MRLVACVAMLAIAGCGAERATPPPPAAAPASSIDEDVKEHFAAEQVAAEKPRRGRFLTARVLRRTTLRSSPAGRVLARVGRQTEFGSPRVFAVTARRDGWLRVTASERANGEHGWIRSSAARIGSTNVWIRVDRSRRELTLRRDRRVLRRLPVAVGRPGTETPLGRFAVTDRLWTKSLDSPYGCCAVALSGHQTKLLPGWPGGDRLAIHATPNPETVGTPASLGCMRAHDRDIRVLMRRVPLGAPVVVVA
jgi:lipoprotein-anchoring transpeptidase ErfK/SrfK